MKNNQILIFLVLLVLVGGGAFFGGMKYQESKQTTLGQQGFGGGNGSGRVGAMGGRSFTGQNGNRAGGGFRPVNGEIINADNTSITVKMPDESSKIVLINDKTTINKAEVATKADLKVGEKVAVFGSTNTDGSVSAQNIQLNPIARMMDRTPQATPSGTK